ncbi:MAG TPA: HAD family hydrolase [Solirubrobacteraceae bacterium]|jgi:HAD superfamily hydrolase (TIGR01509 family)|nr:HAD family hydrolase [Solirubrobacteraceae bacterium]
MIALLDIDGTLVDTNYQHSLAWFRAFRRHDITLGLWRIHRHIGMGGDQVVQALTDEETENTKGDSIREAETEEYQKLIGEVQTMAGATDLIRELKRRGHRVVFASSSKQEEADHYLDLLEARDLVDAWTTSADVEKTKPAPDLVHAALEKVGGEPDDAVLIGDAPWDVKAAEKAGVPTLAVLTGGFAIEELTESGAAAVYQSVEDLLSQLDDTPLG